MSPRPLTATEFEAEPDVSDWTVSGGSVVAEFTVRPYAAAAALVAAIGEAADAADHHPELWLRFPGVVRVEFTTHSIGNGLSSLDAEMARTVSRLASQHGAAPR
jgi:4a-hydroxytetrahydrobiopterin dehydratase